MTDVATNTVEQQLVKKTHPVRGSGEVLASMGRGPSIVLFLTNGHPSRPGCSVEDLSVTQRRQSHNRKDNSHEAHHRRPEPSPPIAAVSFAGHRQRLRTRNAASASVRCTRPSTPVPWYLGSRTSGSS